MTSLTQLHRGSNNNKVGKHRAGTKWINTKGASNTLHCHRNSMTEMEVFEAFSLTKEQI